uniref:TB domain-containing protein n=1 Tax=Parastrongyloides trichosuri TaxID=131310 RepID=A0A0N4Z3T9_PARTI
GLGAGPQLFLAVVLSFDPGLFGWCRAGRRSGPGARLCARGAGPALVCPHHHGVQFGARARSALETVGDSGQLCTRLEQWPLRAGDLCHCLCVWRLCLVHFVRGQLCDWCAGPDRNRLCLAVPALHWRYAGWLHPECPLCREVGSGTHDSSGPVPYAGWRDVQHPTPYRPEFDVEPACLVDRTACDAGCPAPAQKPACRKPRLGAFAPGVQRSLADTPWFPAGADCAGLATAAPSGTGFAAAKWPVGYRRL